MTSTSRYTLTYMVNNKVTCILENLPAHEVYTTGVPTEAFENIEGNRWHTLTRDVVRVNMVNMSYGEKKVIAYQVPPENPELDTEVVYLSKTN